MTQTAIATDDQQDRRRSERAALRLNATIRVASRSRVQARVIDISTHGCRIECTSADIEPEVWLWLSIAGLENQYSRVVWRAREFAGLEFAKPLAEPVLERLLLSQEQVSETTIGELRDIASRSHWLAAQGRDTDVQQLAELSRKCAIDAIVEGFRLTEAKRPDKPA